jgi:hypothetical protein
MICSTVCRGLSDDAGSWNTTCTCRRNSRRAAPFACVTSSPLSENVPDVGSSRRATMRAVVDLPDPDSPTIESV